MVALSTPARASKTPTDDDYFYGYRETRVVDASGEARYERRPLTRLELLHPQENDYEIASYLHGRIGAYLYALLEWALGRLPHVAVLFDVDVIWDDPERLTHRPDVSVVFGVNQIRNWMSFDVRKEGVRPGIIIEVTSRATHENDLVDKFDQFARYGVEWYLIVDPIAPDPAGHVDLRLYHLENGVYRLVAAEPNGWLWLAPAGVWLEGQVDNVAGYDRARQLILRPADALAVLPEARAAVARATAEADEAVDRADAAVARADAEAAARRALEVQLAELQARLQQYEPKTP